MKQPNNSVPVECGCGKLLARYENGKIFVYCKRCRREQEIRVPKEPRAIEPRAVKT